MADTTSRIVKKGVIFDRDPATIDPVEAYFRYNIGTLPDVVKALSERVKALEEGQQ